MLLHLPKDGMRAANKRPSGSAPLRLVSYRIHISFTNSYLLGYQQSFYSDSIPELGTVRRVRPMVQQGTAAQQFKTSPLRSDGARPKKYIRECQQEALAAICSGFRLQSTIMDVHLTQPDPTRMNSI